MKISFLLAALIISIGACAPNAADIRDPQKIADYVAIEDDSFSKIKTYNGPNCAPDASDSLYIRASQKGGVTLYQIYVSDGYFGSWRYYNDAYDSNGQRLEVVEIKKEFIGCYHGICLYDEHIGINVNKEYLEAHRGDGLKFRIFGQDSKQDFYIPAAYITGFIMAVDGAL